MSQFLRYKTLLQCQRCGDSVSLVLYAPSSKFKTLILAACVFTSGALMAGSLETGPPVTAAQLAQQLGVSTFSVTYREEKPIRAIFYSLTWRERDAGGRVGTVSSLMSRTVPLPQPQNSLSLAILVDRTRSSIVSDSFASGGAGVELGGPITTRTPPEKNAEGRYVLIRELIDPSLPESEENTKATLELEIHASNR